MFVSCSLWKLMSSFSISKMSVVLLTTWIVVWSYDLHLTTFVCNVNAQGNGCLSSEVPLRVRQCWNSKLNGMFIQVHNHPATEHILWDYMAACACFCPSGYNNDLFSCFKVKLAILIANSQAMLSRHGKTVWFYVLVRLCWRGHWAGPKGWLGSKWIQEEAGMCVYLPPRCVTS